MDSVGDFSGLSGVITVRLWHALASYTADNRRKILLLLDPSGIARKRSVYIIIYPGNAFVTGRFCTTFFAHCHTSIVQYKNSFDNISGITLN
jgi:hypothetical protein